MHRDGREPRKTDDHREPETQNSDRDSRQRYPTDERDQNSKPARERSARERTLPSTRHRSGGNKAADAEGNEPDHSCNEVNKPRRADGRRRTRRRADRKSIYRISREEGRDDHTRAEDAEEPGRGSRR